MAHVRLPGFGAQGKGGSGGASRPPSKGDGPAAEKGGKRLSSKIYRFWKDLADWPDSYAWDWDKNAYSPLTRLAEQVVVDYREYDPLGPRAERERGARKKQLAMYKRRIFVEGAQEVGSIAVA